jgi:hypothetical protein
MYDELSAEQDRFLETFFSDGNVIGSWPQLLQNEDLSDKLSPFILRFARGQSCVLPRRVSSDVREVYWYGFANIQSQFRELWEDLLAFVGPTYSTFDGMYWELDSTDPFDMSLANVWSGHVLRFRSGRTTKERDALRQHLIAMLNCRDRMPSGHALGARPVGQILRDLEMALRAKDFDGAAQCRDEAFRTGILSAHNRLFLEFRFLQAQQAWQEILEFPGWSTVLDVVRPPGITECLIEALYNVHYQVFEDQGDVEVAVKFCQSTRQKYGRLFNSSANIHSPTALRCFLFEAASRDDRASFERVMEQLPDGILDEPFYRQLQEMLSPAEVAPGEAVDHLHNARLAYFRGDFQDCLTCLSASPPSAEFFTVLSRCVIQLGTESAYHQARCRMDEAPAVEVQAALQDAGFWEEWREFEERICRGVSGYACEDWLAWVELLGKEDVDWQELQTAAGDLEGRNVAAELIQDGASVLALVDQVTASGTQELRYAAPLLIKGFLDKTGAQSAFVPLYLLIIEHLVLEDMIATNDSLAISELTIACLSGGVSFDQAEALYELLDAASNRMISWDSLDLVLDVTDALVVHRSPPPPTAQSLFTQCLELASRNPLRLRPAQIEIFRVLSADLTDENLIADLVQRRTEGGVDEEPASLTEKRLLIYTLTESAGRRAVQVLRQAFSPKSVDLNVSLAGNDQLKQHAQHADICVMVTWSATHAATNFIQDNLRQDAALLLPPGKGSSSILRVVEEHVLSLSSLV